MNDMLKHNQINTVLIHIQSLMSTEGFWSDIDIDSSALNSQQPFCCDTMNFNEWLQFVFIPKMQFLIDTRKPLPSFKKGQGIGPMAKEFYNQTQVDHYMITLIGQIDDLLEN